MKLLPRIILAPILLHLGAGMAWADDVNLEGLTWTEQKCVLYQRAWDWAYDNVGPDGIGPEFITQNDSFVASGCIELTVVCPRSDKELEMANLLTVLTMNEGMASTFVPFRCQSVTE